MIKLKFCILFAFLQIVFFQTTVLAQTVLLPLPTESGAFQVLNLPPEVLAGYNAQFKVPCIVKSSSPVIIKWQVYYNSTLGFRDVNPIAYTVSDGNTFVSTALFNTGTAASNVNAGLLGTNTKIRCLAKSSLTAQAPFVNSSEMTVITDSLGPNRIPISSNTEEYPISNYGIVNKISKICDHFGANLYGWLVEDTQVSSPGAYGRQLDFYVPPKFTVLRCFAFYNYINGSKTVSGTAYGPPIFIKGTGASYVPLLTENNKSIGCGTGTEAFSCEIGHFTQYPPFTIVRLPANGVVSVPEGNQATGSCTFTDGNGRVAKRNFNFSSTGPCPVPPTPVTPPTNNQPPIINNPEPTATRRATIAQTPVSNIPTPNSFFPPSVYNPNSTATPNNSQPPSVNPTPAGNPTPVGNNNPPESTTPTSLPTPPANEQNTPPQVEPTPIIPDDNRVTFTVLVQDKNTKEPVSGAKVSYITDKKTYKTKTDDNGEARQDFEKGAIAAVLVSAKGYIETSTDVKNLKKDTRVKIQMQSNSNSGPVSTSLAIARSRNNKKMIKKIINLKIQKMLARLRR